MPNDFDTLTPEDQELITRIKWKVDSQSVASALEENPCQPYVYPPASVEEIRWAEAGIGAKLPPLIRELFLQVGNGGFGPGLGITGLLTGTEIYNRSFVENVRNTAAAIKVHLRESIAEAERDAQMDVRLLEQDRRHYENWLRLGQDQLIWYCDWGCNIVTLVDYTRPELPIYCADGLDVRKDSIETLRQWWQNWLNGTLEPY